MPRISALNPDRQFTATILVVTKIPATHDEVGNEFERLINQSDVINWVGIAVQEGFQKEVNNECCGYGHSSKEK
jgi:hypothetical protein